MPTTRGRGDARLRARDGALRDARSCSARRSSPPTTATGSGRCSPLARRGGRRARARRVSVTYTQQPRRAWGPATRGVRCLDAAGAGDVQASSIRPTSGVGLNYDDAHPQLPCQAVSTGAYTCWRRSATSRARRPVATASRACWLHSRVVPAVDTETRHHRARSFTTQASGGVRAPAAGPLCAYLAERTGALGADDRPGRRGMGRASACRLGGGAAVALAATRQRRQRLPGRLIDGAAAHRPPRAI